MKNKKEKLKNNTIFKKIIKYNDNTIYFYNYKQTINQIINGKSFIRFGDGEYLLMMGNNISFQKYIKSFKSKFENILKNNNDNKKYIIGLYLKQNYNKKWNEYNENIINIFNKNNNTNKCIYIHDALIFRHSIYYKDIIIIFFNYLKNKNILTVHKSPDPLTYFRKLAKNYSFIKCKDKNCFDQYDYLIEECTKYSKDYIIILSCGPCAKILGYELTKLGYQVIDVGFGKDKLRLVYDKYFKIL